MEQEYEVMSLTEEQELDYLILSEEFTDIQNKIALLQEELEKKKEEIRECLRVGEYRYHAAPELNPGYEDIVREHKQEHPIIVDQVAVEMQMRKTSDYECPINADARNVYAAILDGPKTVQQIAETTKLSKAQVRHRLKNHLETRVRKVGKAGRSDLWDVCRVTDSEVIEKIKELGPRFPNYKLGNAMGDSMVAEELNSTINRLKRRGLIEIETIEEQIAGGSHITQMIICKV